MRRNEEVGRRNQEGGRLKVELSVVTWNVQRMSLTERRKEKARGVADYARRSGWDAVLLSEVRAERKGVVWLGEEEEKVVIVHSEKAGVLLRGELLRKWCEGGMVQKLSRRVVSVKVGELMLT